MHIELRSSRMGWKPSLGSADHDFILKFTTMKLCSRLHFRVTLRRVCGHLGPSGNFGSLFFISDHCFSATKISLNQETRNRCRGRRFDRRNRAGFAGGLAVWRRFSIARGIARPADVGGPAAAARCPGLAATLDSAVPRFAPDGRFCRRAPVSKTTG